VADQADTMSQTMKTGKHNLLASTRMTSVERLKGRFMRAPDGHDPAPDPAPAADPAPAPPAPPSPPADPAQPIVDDPPPQAAADPDILGGAGDDPKPGDPPAADPAPVIPEAYELTPPEGFEKLDDETVQLATPVFKDLGLSNEQANKLMPVAGKFAQRIQQQHNQAILDEVTAQRTAWAKEAQEDAEIGGAKFDETKHLAAKGLDALGYPKGSPFRSFLTDSGLSNHPEMIRAMRKIGELVGEDNDFIRPNAGAPVSRKSREEILYPDDVQKDVNA
jgi:hypothetical protein